MSDESAWVEEFLNCRFPLFNDEIRLDEATEIILNNKPDKLYKYRQADSFGFSVIEKGELWLARANTVEDEFDCFYTYDPEIILDSIEQKFKEIPPSNSNEVVRQFRRRDIECLFNNQRDSFRNTIKLCSLSRQSDISKMWENYSENYMGFCIEFDLQKANYGIWEYLFPVLYSETKVDFSSYFIMILKERQKLNPSFIRRAALTKSLDWAHEKEWRIIAPDKPEKLGIECSCIPISCVYLGYEASQETTARVESLCMQKGIPVKKMQKKDNMLVVAP
jgi:hypothetical protein